MQAMFRRAFAFTLTICLSGAVQSAELLQSGIAQPETATYQWLNLLTGERLSGRPVSYSVSSVPMAGEQAFKDAAQEWIQYDQGHDSYHLDAQGLRIDPNEQAFSSPMPELRFSIEHGCMSLPNGRLGVVDYQWIREDGQRWQLAHLEVLVMNDAQAQDCAQANQVDANS